MMASTYRYCPGTGVEITPGDRTDRQSTADETAGSLMDVTGITERVEQKLEQRGVHSPADLHDWTTDELTSVTGICAVRATRIKGDVRDRIDDVADPQATSGGWGPLSDDDETATAGTDGAESSSAGVAQQLAEAYEDLDIVDDVECELTQPDTIEVTITLTPDVVTPIDTDIMVESADTDDGTTDDTRTVGNIELENGSTISVDDLYTGPQR